MPQQLNKEFFQRDIYAPQTALIVRGPFVAGVDTQRPKIMAENCIGKKILMFLAGDVSDPNAYRGSSLDQFQAVFGLSRRFASRTELTVAPDL